MSDWMYVLAVYTTAALTVVFAFTAIFLAGYEHFHRVKKAQKEAFDLWEKNAAAAKAKGREPKPFEEKKVQFEWSVRLVYITACSAVMWALNLYIGTNFA